MRLSQLKSNQNEDEESVFVSMTDMIVSFLFIMLILLAFFAVQFSNEDSVPKSVYVAVKGELEEVQKKYQQAIIEIEQLGNIILILRNDLNTEQKENNRLTEINIQLTTLINQLRDKILTITELNKSLNIENQRISEENDNLKNEKLALEEIIIKLRLKIGDLQEQLKRSQSEITRLQLIIEKLEARLKNNPLEQYIARAQIRRELLLQAMKERLLTAFPKLMVEVSPENDALRFKGDGLFATNSHVLDEKNQAIIERLGDIIAEVTNCFVILENPPNYTDCNADGIIIESLQIEGHTDSRGIDDINVPLSTNRAVSAFRAMIGKNPKLLEYKNIKMQPILGLAGYGSWRPISQEILAENRRIDIRLIMYTPENVTEIEDIKETIQKRRMFNFMDRQNQ